MSHHLSAGAGGTAECAYAMHTNARHHAEVHHHYTIECFSPDGTQKWREEFENLVTMAGLNKYLDATLKTGLAAPAWYVGLMNTGTIVSTDTMNSHPEWTENTGYSNSTRPAWTPGTISGGSVDNSAAPAVFNINTTTTIYGAFISDNSTAGGATGTLLGGGDFTASRSALNGDTVNVTITLSLS